MKGPETEDGALMGEERTMGQDQLLAMFMQAALAGLLSRVPEGCLTETRSAAEKMAKTAQLYAVATLHEYNKVVD